MKLVSILDSSACTLAPTETFKLIIKNNRQLMKKANKLDENLAEDLEFARRTEEALKRYEKGEFKEMSAEEFSKELEKSITPPFRKGHVL